MGKIQDNIKKFVEIKITEGKLKKEDKELYEYAYLFLSLQLFNVTTVLLIGLIFRCLLPMILFVAVIMPLRSYAGGYHADTPERCSFLSALLELFVAILVTSQFYTGYMTVIVGIAVAAQVVIWLLAPIEAANKPLTVDEEKKYRGKTRAILLVEMVVLFALFYLGYETGAFVVAVCHIYTAFSLLIVKCRKKAVVVS